jgi:hypothetical protein
LFAKATSLLPEGLNPTELVTQNWTTIAGIGLPAGVAAVTYFRYKGELKAKQELLAMQQKMAAEQAKLEAETNSKSLLNLNLEKELDTYRHDNTSMELQKSLSLLQDDKARLTAQLLEARSSAASTLEGLWGKSGGQVIVENGEKYKIIEKEILKVM